MAKGDTYYFYQAGADRSKRFSSEHAARLEENMIVMNYMQAHHTRVTFRKAIEGKRGSEVIEEMRPFIANG